MNSDRTRPAQRGALGLMHGSAALLLLAVSFPVSAQASERSCVDTASVILSELALPVIGKELPLGGYRLDFDRRGEKRPLPVLSDGVRTSGRPAFETRVQMGPPRENPKEWRVAIQREFDPGVVEKGRSGRLSVDAILVYGMAAVDSRSVCRLERIEVRLSGESRAISSADCLKLLDPDARWAASGGQKASARAATKERGKEPGKDLAKEPVNSRLLRHWLRRTCLLDPRVEGLAQNY